MRRRDFIKASLGCLASSVFTTGLTIGLPKRANAEGVVDFALSAEEVMKPVLATEMLTWQFVDTAATPLGQLQSQMVVNEGDTVRVQLTNNLSAHSINFTVPGLLDLAPEVAPGNTLVYEFVASQAGSYVYFDAFNGELGRAMGLAGPLVVLPASGASALYEGAPAQHQYDRQYVLLFQEFDSRVNNAIQVGQAVDMETFEPEFFYVNGLSYPDTVYDAAGNLDDSRVIYMQANEKVALRFINGGLIYYPMHFHGYHTQVVLRNRVLETHVVEKDTVLVKTAECVDSILPVGDQLGLYPLHTHYVPGVTTNGWYAGGGLLMMKAV